MRLRSKLMKIMYACKVGNTKKEKNVYRLKCQKQLSSFVENPLLPCFQMYPKQMQSKFHYHVEVCFQNNLTVALEPLVSLVILSKYLKNLYQRIILKNQNVLKQYFFSREQMFKVNTSIWFIKYA